MLARELVRRIRAGDRDAETELVCQYGPEVMRMLRSLTGNDWFAEDLHQETFAIVIVRLRGRGLNDPDALGQFLRQTARKLVLVGKRKKRRRQQREVEGTELDEYVDPEPGQLVRVISEEQRKVVREIIAGLRPKRYGQLLESVYVRNEPKARICETFGLSAEHYNRVLWRARRRFERDLRKYLLARSPTTSKKK